MAALITRVIDSEDVQSALDFAGQSNVIVSTPNALKASTPAALEVLLAERNDDARLMYAEYFRHSNVHLDEASDGRQALAKALARPHDVIITETRLPGINGY